MHRSIEVLIGRLVTDEDFRARFRRDPRSALAVAGAWGIELNGCELTALLDTDRRLWDRVAAQLDPRLQKASLRGPEESNDAE